MWPTVRAQKGKHKQPQDAQLTDAEFIEYVKAPDTMNWTSAENEERLARDEPLLVCREIKTMAVVARMIGGARTCDIHAMIWERVDTTNWQWVKILRPKVSHRGEPRVDHYENLPSMAVAWLMSWWDLTGRKTMGPVFPVRTMHSRGGKAAVGKPRKNGSYARRFRRDLMAAGVTRELLHKGGKDGDTLFAATTFHALRGAWTTALDELQVPEEERLKLTSHKSVSVHTLYQKQGRPMPIPDGVDLGVMPPGYEHNDDAPEGGSGTSAKSVTE